MILIEKFIVFLILMILIGVFIHTVMTFYEITKGRIKDAFKDEKVKNVNNHFPSGEMDRWIDESLYLDSYLKWKIWMYSTSLILILCLYDYIDILSNHKILSIFSFILGLIVLIGIGDFLHSIKFTGILGFLFYIIQLCVLLIYILSFTLKYFEDISDVKTLMLITIIFIAYSFLFVKNVVDSFPSYLFQFLNFIFILLFLNMIGIGLTFGAFYLENNETFEYYSENEITLLNESLGENNFTFQYSDLMLIIYKGIEPFFNFPTEIDSVTGIIGFIPFLEHIIGNIFNLLIIGFFVSYSVTKLFERRKDKNLSKSKR